MNITTEKYNELLEKLELLKCGNEEMSAGKAGLNCGLILAIDNIKKLFDQ